MQGKDFSRVYEWISSCSSFAGIEDRLLAQIASSAELVAYPSNSYVYLQGQSADHFYIVADGSVEILANEILKGESRISFESQGSLIGDGGYFFGGSERRHNMSARVHEDAQFIKISVSWLETIAKQHPKILAHMRENSLRSVLEPAPTTDLLDMLREPIMGIPDLECPVFNDAEKVFPEGAASDHVFVVLSGSIRISKRQNDGSDITLARLRPGQLFGEGGLDNGSPRAASAFSEGKSSLLRIKISDFKKILDENHKIEAEIGRQRQFYSNGVHENDAVGFLKNMKIATRMMLVCFLTFLVVSVGCFAFMRDVVRTEVLRQQDDRLTTQLTAAENDIDLGWAEIVGALDTMTQEANKDLSENDRLEPFSHRYLDAYFAPLDRIGDLRLPEDFAVSFESLIADRSADLERGNYAIRRVDIGNEGYILLVRPVLSEAELLGVSIGIYRPEGSIRSEGASIVWGTSDLEEGFIRDIPAFEQAVETGKLVSGTVAAVKTRPVSVIPGFDDAYLFVDESSEVVGELLGELDRIALILLLAGLICSALIGKAFAAWSLRPLKDMVYALARLSEGQRGIEVPYLGRSNEIGALSRAVDSVQQDMQHQERVIADKMIDQQQRIERQERIKQMVINFEAKFAVFFEEFIGSVHTANEVSKGMLSGASSASQSVQSIQSAFASTRKSIEQVEKLTEDLKSATSSIEDRTNKSQRSLEEAVSNTSKANEKIEHLDQVVDGIDSIVKTISGIAENTRLLAVNATIEARKAGAAGRGFAIVAQEVRTLAHQTSDATDDITKRIKDIEDASGEVVYSLGSITKVISRMREEQEGIIDAVSSQRAATNNITDDVRKTSTQTQDVADSLFGISELVNSSEEGAKDLNSSARGLRLNSGKLKVEIERFLKSILTR